MNHLYLRFPEFTDASASSYEGVQDNFLYFAVLAKCF